MTLSHRHHHGGLLGVYVLVTLVTMHLFGYVSSSNDSNNVYVSVTSGNDSTGNGSQSLPYGSITGALLYIATQTLSMNNTIHLDSGSYPPLDNTDLDLTTILAPLPWGHSISFNCTKQPCIIGSVITTDVQYHRFASVNCSVTSSTPCMNMRMYGITIIGGNGTRGGCISAINTDIILYDTIMQNATQQCVYIRGTSLTTRGGIFRNNGYNATSISVGGGAIQIGGHDSSISVLVSSSTIFQSNSAPTSAGGAIAVVKLGTLPTTTNQYADITLTWCQFVSNTAPQGGALSLSLVTMNVTATTFTRNIASNGAGAIAFLVNVGQTIWVANTFSYNTGVVIPSSTLTSTGSGGIYINTGNSTFRDCTWQSNTGFWGSCLQMVGAGTHRVYNALFQGNSAVYGTVDIGRNIPRPDAKFYTSVWRSNTASLGTAGINIQAPTTIQSCTFTSNYGYYGGALYITAGGSIITSSQFNNNWATFQGGAFAINYAGAVNTTFTGLTLSSNSSPSGGAVVSTLGSGVWTNVVFLYNSAYSLVGGGALMVVDGTHSFITCVFSGNSAPNGGAIQVSAGAIYASGSSFTSNTAVTNGGAFYRAVNTNTNANVLPLAQVFEGCTFTANYGAQGGAIATMIGQITVLNCQFSANTAVQGGAMSFQGGTITVSGGALTANSATGSGGGVYHSNGNMLMQSVTFTACKAALYGGAYALISDAGVNPTVTMNSLPVLFSSAAAGGAFALQGGNFNFLQAFCMGNSGVGGLNIDGAGGCVLLLAGTNVYMKNSVMLQNTATVTGGAVMHSTPTSSLLMDVSVFSSNSAPSGGAITFKGPFQLIGATSPTASGHSIISLNSAERGGGVYAFVCPSAPWYGTTFGANKASRVGGAFLWAASAPLCDSPCVVNNPNTTVLSPWSLKQGFAFGCDFNGNTALVGPDMATEAHHLVVVPIGAPVQNYTQYPTNDTTGMPTSISVLGGTLSLEVRVLNYYGEIMRSIDGVTESYMVGLSTIGSGVIINGRSLETVVNGIATFNDITFKPDESLIGSANFTISSLSDTVLSIAARPSLTFGAVIGSLLLTDIVLPGDTISSDYSGGSVVLALLVAVVGSWTSVIFIEEAVFCMQGRVRSHMPYTFVASIALGLCGVWGGFVMELGALELPSVGINMQLTPDLVLGSIPIAIFVVWIAIEFYIREFGRRVQRIQKTPRADFTYNGPQEAQSKAESMDRRPGAAGNGEMINGSIANGSVIEGQSHKSSSGGSKGAPKVAPAPSNATSTPQPPRIYPLWVRFFRDFLLPRVVIGNIIMGALLALLTLLLTSTIRWQASLTINSGNLIAGIIVGVITSHIAFWLMFNLNVLRFICPFAVAGSSLIIHHVVMIGNVYTYEPTRQWTELTWTPTSYAIIVSAITAVMCFLFTGIQFSRMQLSRNALHVILNKAKGQIAILETSLGESRRQGLSFEKNAADLSRMLELITFCGPTYTNHSLALAFAKDKPFKPISLRDKDNNKDKDGNTNTTTSMVSVPGGPTSTIASTTMTSSIAVPTASAGIHTTTVAAVTHANSVNNALLQAFIPMHHSESSYLATLDKVDEAIKDPSGILAKLDADLELRDIVKNAVTLEIFKHFMMSEHAAESLGLYLDIQRYKMLGTKEARGAMGQRMVHEYLEDKSPQEVNVGQATRVQVMKEVTTKKWPATMFEPVEKALYSLMSMDTMVRFRKTKDYVTCALLLGTFGQMDRQVLDLPNAPPITNDEVSIVRPRDSIMAQPPSKYEIITTDGATTPVHAMTTAMTTTTTGVNSISGHHGSHAPIITLGMSSSPKATVTPTASATPIFGGNNGIGNGGGGMTMTMSGYGRSQTGSPLMAPTLSMTPTNGGSNGYGNGGNGSIGMSTRATSGIHGNSGGGSGTTSGSSTPVNMHRINTGANNNITLIGGGTTATATVTVTTTKTNTSSGDNAPMLPGAMV